MKDGTNEDGSEVAKISVSTGTTGGGEPSTSEDDVSDKDSFVENVEFNVNYQQNGRVTGTTTNQEGPDEMTPGRRRRPSTNRLRRHSSRRKYRLLFRANRIVAVKTVKGRVSFLFYSFCNILLLFMNNLCIFVCHCSPANLLASIY